MISLKKRIWPGYIPPENDELFSSWLIRLSREHLIKTHTFSKYYLNSANIWNRDIDLIGSPKLKKSILDCTPLNVRQVDNLFLAAYETYFIEKIMPDRINQGIKSIGIFHRKRKKNGLSVCPKCLDKKVVHFKKKWRLNTSLFCVDCMTPLNDFCLMCSAPIAFHRTEQNILYDFNLPLYKCYNCNNDLRSQTIVTCNATSRLYHDYQKKIDDTLLNGYNDKTQYSFLYFGILNFMSTRYNSKNAKWNLLFKDLLKNYPNIRNLAKNKLIPEKHIGFLLIFNLLEDSNAEFEIFCKTSRFNYSDFTNYGYELPFWLEKKIKCM